MRPKSVMRDIHPANGAIHALAASKRVTSIELIRSLGYSRPMAYKIASGECRVQFELVGRILKKYGADAAKNVALYMKLPNAK